jgi:hypothetical protein
MKKWGTSSGNLWSPVTMNGARAARSLAESLRGTPLSPLGVQGDNSSLARRARGGGRQAGGFPEEVSHFFIGLRYARGIITKKSSQPAGLILAQIKQN